MVTRDRVGKSQWVANGTIAISSVVRYTNKYLNGYGNVKIRNRKVKAFFFQLMYLERRQMGSIREETVKKQVYL